MKTIQEQIEVMQYFADDNGIIERTEINKDNWRICNSNIFNWDIYDYRIKEQKKTITIEKWLCEYNNCEELKGSNRFFIIEKAFPFEIGGKKIKRLECYKIEL